MTEVGQSFSFEPGFDVNRVEIDPQGHLITGRNQSTLGLDEETLGKSITIYPNPLNDLMIIKNDGTSQLKRITIYDLLGKKVLQQAQPPKELPVGGLKFGLHLVVIDTDQGTLRKTILKN